MTTSPKPSRLASLSLATGILTWFMWCPVFPLSAVLIYNASIGETGFANIFLAAILAVIVSIGLGIAGIVSGILALRKNDAKRRTAIAGLILNILCLAPLILLIGWWQMQ